MSDRTYFLVLGAVVGLYVGVVVFWTAEWLQTRRNRRRDAARRFFVEAGTISRRNERRRWSETIR